MYFTVSEVDYISLFQRNQVRGPIKSVKKCGGVIQNSGFKTSFGFSPNLLFYIGNERASRCP